MTNLIQLLMGLSVLLFGRRLFWLFVGAVGFMLAFTLAKPLLVGQPEWQVLVVSLGAGLLGALCARAVERVAVTVAGFVAGCGVAIQLMEVATLGHSPLVWFVVVAGGVLGALMVSLLFDWALIVLSSVVGASLVTNYFSAGGGRAGLLFPVLLIVGVAAQASQLRRRVA